jgi:hypothetical protein
MLPSTSVLELQVLVIQYLKLVFIQQSTFLEADTALLLNTPEY